MAYLDKIKVGDTTYDIQDSNLKSALNVVDDTFNLTNSFVNYGYDDSYSQDITGDTWKTSIAVTRAKTVVMLNRPVIPSGQVFIRLSGSVELQTLNANVDAWGDGFDLIAGHKYKAKLIVLSGDSVYDEEVGDRAPVISVLKTGTHNTTGERTIDATSCTVTFTAESTKYNIVIYLSNRKYTLTNVKAVITLEDLTESTIYNIQTDLDSETNVVHAGLNLCNYGYETPYSQGITGTTWKTSIAINRNQEVVTLNRPTIPSGQLYIKLSGSVELQTLNANVDAWNTGFTLNSGHTYRARAILVSGNSIYDETVGTQPPYMMVLATGTHTTVGLRTNSERESRIDFIADDSLYNIALFLGNGKYTLDNAKIVVILEDLSTQISDNTIPYYYREYVPQKINDVINSGLNVGLNGTRFIFITDYHTQSNARKSGALMRKVSEKTGVKNVVFGGDAEQSEATEFEGYKAILDMIDDFNSVSELCNMYYITGNHEMNNPSGNPDYSDRMIPVSTIGRLFRDQMPKDVVMLFDENNSFYRDDNSAKIRMYFIGCDSKAIISIDTRRKVIQSLQDIPSGYAVFLISHVGLAWDDTLGHETIQWRAKNIIDCCTAMNDGTATTIYLGPDSTIPLTVDFTGKQHEFIGMLCGHTHRDGYVIHDSRFPIVSTACDAYQVQSSIVPPPHGQQVGTIYEQCFDVVQIDNDNKYMYMTRIGDGADRTFKYGENAGLVT